MPVPARPLGNGSMSTQGVIQTWEDVERYPWPRRDSLGFDQAEAAIACLPDGMEAIGFSGGVLEWASTLMGLEHFMMTLHEDPALVERSGGPRGAADPGRVRGLLCDGRRSSPSGWATTWASRPPR